MRDYKLILNLVTNEKPGEKIFKQYDTGNEIELELYQNEHLNADEKLVLTNESVLAFFKRQDGQVLQKNCSIRNGNAIIKTSKDVLGVPGILELECMVKKGDVETTTTRMTFTVKESIARDGAIEEDPRYTSDLVTELLDVRDNVKAETIGKIEEVASHLEENIAQINNINNNKVDKKEGKGLSTNDYTDDEQLEVAKVQNKIDKNATGWAGLDIFNEQARRVIENIDSGNINAVLGEGNVVNENVGFNEISLEKTDFFKNIIPYSGVLLLKGQILNTEPYSLVNLNNLNCKVIRFAVSPGRKYKIYAKNNDKFRIVGTNKEQNLEMVSDPKAPTQVITVNDDSLKNFEFTVNDNTNFIYIYLTSTNANVNATLYDIDNVLELTQKFRADEVKTVKGSNNKNLITKEYRKVVVSFTEWETKLTLTTDTSIPKQCFYAPLEKNTDYVIKVKKFGDRFRILKFDENVEFTEEKQSWYVSNDKYYNIIKCFDTWDRDEIRFNSGDSIEVWIYTSSNADLYESEIELYKPINEEVEIFDKNTILVDRNKYDTNLFKRRYSLTDLPIGRFSAPELTNMTEDDEINLATSNANLIYQEYDKLVNYDSQYVSKKLRTTDVNGNNIFEYDFIPKNITLDKIQADTIPFKLPNILINTGIHGNEKGAVWGTLQFFKNLVMNFESSELLTFIRYNVAFKVKVLANPYGFNNNIRFIDTNNTDANRFFKYKKSEMPIESLDVANFIDENRHADFFIDFHNSWSEKGKNLAWVITQGNDIKLMEMANATIKNLSINWRNRYSFLEQDKNFLFGYSGENKNAGVLMHMLDSQTRAYAFYHGINAVTLEFASNVDYPQAGKQYAKTDLEMNCDLIGNFIATICRTFV